MILRDDWLRAALLFGAARHLFERLDLPHIRGGVYQLENYLVTHRAVWKPASPYERDLFRHLRMGWAMVDPVNTGLRNDFPRFELVSHPCLRLAAFVAKTGQISSMFPWLRCRGGARVLVMIRWPNAE